MIISNELWKKIKTMKQELLNLKQIKKANCASKYYTYTITGQNYFHWRITYKSGSQPIIADVFSDGITSLSSPSGNTQYLFFFAQYPAKITIYSTREIQSIVGIS